uniref:Uncharacterized protein n=1 Tax=Arundo donax TaxID=35708 RepID=A0A0A9EFU2_ARUDO
MSRLQVHVNGEVRRGGRVHDAGVWRRQRDRAARHPRRAVELGFPDQGLPADGRREHHQYHSNESLE